MKIQLAFALLLSTMVATSAAPAQEFDGQISGVAVDAAGKPLADQRIELRRPRDQGPLRVVTTTDANGAFTYARLGPGRYEVELRAQDRVVATSGPIELTEAKFILLVAAADAGLAVYEDGTSGATVLVHGGPVPDHLERDDCPRFAEHRLGSNTAT